MDLADESASGSCRALCSGSNFVCTAREPCGGKYEDGLKRSGSVGNPLEVWIGVTSSKSSSRYGCSVAGRRGNLGGEMLCVSFDVFSLDMFRFKGKSNEAVEDGDAVPDSDSGNGSSSGR